MNHLTGVHLLAQSDLLPLQPSPNPSTYHRQLANSPHATAWVHVNTACIHLICLLIHTRILPFFVPRPPTPTDSHLVIAPWPKPHHLTLCGSQPTLISPAPSLCPAACPTKPRPRHRRPIAPSTSDRAFGACPFTGTYISFLFSSLSSLLVTNCSFPFVL